MPLLPGKKNIGHNIAVEEAAGKPKDQAVAIAMHKAYDEGKSKKEEGFGAFFDPLNFGPFLPDVVHKANPHRDHEGKFTTPEKGKMAQVHRRIKEMLGVRVR